MSGPVAHPIHRFSAIARPVEPKVATNLAILVIMGLVTAGLLVTALVRGAAPVDAGLAGLLGALVVFATWALARDLAPDDDPAAFVALVPAAAVVLTGADPTLLAPMAALGLVRVVNRSVGPPATVVDCTTLVVLVFVCAREGHGFGVGLAAVLAFGLDALLPERERQGWIFAGLAGAATLMGMAIGQPDLALVAPGPWAWGAIGCAVAFGLVIVLQRPPTSPPDTEPDQTLRRSRVRGGMLVGLVAASGSLMGGDEAVRTWVVMWAAMLGVVLTRPLLRWRQARRAAPASGPPELDHS